ncbi:DEAD/DEAH box helicase [Capilliphycus salinus ALCB114379]|uniref:DEAD/DEAH box helicase n=1 Tax=Capilliphycus salinus TaxID=2768948 RepID=UPI0039A787CF
MAILHGSWLQQSTSSFLIWAENWRRITPNEFKTADGILDYPFALSATELKKGLKEQQLSVESNRVVSEILALPTELSQKTGLNPLQSNPQLDSEKHLESVCLYPWKIEGICLNSTEAFEFLQSLPLGNLTTENSFLGSDLQFWSHLSRWSLDLLARSKFLPSLTSNPSKDSVFAQWKPLLDSATDQARLIRFSKQIPSACRMYQLYSTSQPNNTKNYLALDLPPNPQTLIEDFLTEIIDSQVRKVAQESEKKAITNLTAIQPGVQSWLHALASDSQHVQSENSELEPLEKILKNWTAPLQQTLAEHNLFRTGFHLLPPEKNEKNWTLDYCLQAIDEPEFLVDAQTIWTHPVEAFVHKGRTIKRPQETLLKGLGLASKLYPLLEPSLQDARPHSCVLTPLQAYEFIKSVAWRFTDSGLGVILPPSLASQNGWANRLGLSIQAATSKSKQKGGLGLNSLLNFKWELSIGGQTLSQTEFNRLVAQESPLVEVNGEWVELRPSDIKAAQAFFSSRKDKLSLTLEDALRLSTGDSQMVEKLPVVNFEAGGKLEELLNTLTNNRSLAEIKTPNNFKGELRPYQARGVSWLAFLEEWGLGACLADDMGLGKTIELIAFLLYLQEKESLDAPVLLVCPTSVLGNWEREVKRFSPTLKVTVHHGDKRKKGKSFTSFAQKYDLIITSYPLTFRDEKELKTVTWKGLVLDEAQNIKNPEAKQSKTARNLEANFKIALTGTPVENRLSELWSIMDFLNPGYLGQKQFFQRRFAIPIEKYGDTDSLQTLRSLVQPFILRRLKSDKDIIQDLPEKQENTVFCSLSTEQASLYQKIVDQSLAEIDSAEGIQRRGMILGLLVKLKQVCNHPILLNGKSTKTGKNKIENQSLSAQSSGKLQRFKEMLEELLSEGDRAIVFTQFAEWGKILQPYLEQQLNREVLFLYGATRKNKREEMIDRFQQDPQGPPIFILSLKAGGVGLNLTRANHVFHFDRWWNPAVENQATDRVFRIGQTRNVQVHKFVSTGTLEEKIHDLIESKKALAEQVVGAGEDWLTELDTDQLRNLLILDRNSVIDEEE